MFKWKKKKNKEKTPEEVYSFSEIGEKYNFRVSTPQGYFPEDVDRVIIDLEHRLESLSNDNLKLRKERDEAVADKKVIDEEYKKLRWDMSVFEVPHTSAQEDIAMLNELSNVNSSVEPANEEVISTGDEDDDLDFVLDIISDNDSSKKLDISDNKKEENVADELDDEIELIV